MDYGKRIKLTFDRAVSHVTIVELPRWALKNAYGNLIYPISIGYGETQSIVYLDFADFNSIVEPVTLECLGCIAMGSPDLPIDAFSVPVHLKNLYQIPSDYEYLTLSSIAVEGTITVGFDGKLYSDEYLQIASISVTGTNVLLTFNQRYNSEYLQVASISVSGQYCDINGIPL